MKQKGFTLIEIMVSLGILTTIGGMGIAAYNSFDSVQRVKQATLTLENNLRYAQASALSSLVPDPACTRLDGYVFRAENATTYKIQGRCDSGDYSLRTVTLPPGASLIGPFPFEIIFQVLTRGVINAGTVTVQNYDGTKKFDITVDATGSISGP